MTIEQLEHALRELMTAASQAGLARSFAQLQYDLLKGFGKLSDKAA